MIADMRETTSPRFLVMCAWLKRAVGEVVVLGLAIAFAIALVTVLVPIDVPGKDEVRPRAFYDRMFLQQLLALPVWIGAYYVLHKLYGRWRHTQPR